MTDRKDRTQVALFLDENVDWDLLIAQRNALLALPTSEALEGLVSMCDWLLDVAADELGEVHVFGRKIRGA